MIRKGTILLLSIFTLTFMACSDSSTGPGDGSGGGDGDGGGGTGNTPSVTADAGTAQDATVGFEVVADGSGSTGSSTVSYSWAITASPTNSSASLNGASTASPVFTPDLPGEYTLTLTATSDGETDTDAVTYSAIAKRLFVDANSGTDGDTDGYIAASPLKTITKALDITGQSETDPFLDIDTLRVAEGSYDQANGESFPMQFTGDLIVKGDMNADRDNIHILSPDVAGDPAVGVGEGVTLRHLHIENGYTGGTFNGDPDAVYVYSGSSSESSYVILEDVTLRTNNDNGFILSTGSNINVEVRGSNGARSTIDGKEIGLAYTNRFNTSNARLDIRDTDVMGIGHGDAFQLEAASNGTAYFTNSTIKPGATSSQNNAAININGNGSLLLENTTITSSSGTEGGNRFKYAIDMDSDHPSFKVDVIESTLQYTLWSAIEMYASVFYVTDSLIEGVSTQDTSPGADLARSGIDQLDGTLVLRGTTIRNSKGNAITVDGPVSPNDDGFFVDLGTGSTAGGNIFQNIDGFDVLIGRGSGDVSGEVTAIGNSWSNGSGAPSCGSTLPGSSENADAEVYVADSSNSLRWGTGAGEVCN